MHGKPYEKVFVLIPVFKEELSFTCQVALRF